MIMSEITMNNKHLFKVSDIIKVEGKSYKITKKGTTAFAVERYYFWNKAWDWFYGKFKIPPELD